ncbi:MAG: hypothetical protein ACK5MY_04170 [Jhaorihella sp.]
MIYAIPLLSVLAGLGLGHAMTMRGRWRASALICLAGALCWVAVLSIGKHAQGWNGLDYVVAAMLILAPWVLGQALGTLIGRWRRR